MRTNPKRKPPEFWWDFDGPNLDVVVQSDWPGGQCLARFSTASKCKDKQIEAAEKLIKEYKSGRLTPVWGNT